MMIYLFQKSDEIGASCLSDLPGFNVPKRSELRHETLPIRGKGVHESMEK